MSMRVIVYTLFISFLLTRTALAQDNGVDLAKIDRFLGLGMFSEAKAAIEPAIKENEFDGQLRYLYGISLAGLHQYTEAIHELTIATKLEADNYHFSDALLKAYASKLANSPTNDDRVAAFEVAGQLHNVTSSDMARDPARSDRADLIAAKDRALAMIS